MFKKENIRKNFLRVKQIADQNLGRVEKTEVLSDDLQESEKRVELVKHVSSNTIKKLSGSLVGSGSGDVDKRLKKMPEAALGHSMIESASLLGDCVMGQLYQSCGECQNNLAQNHLQFEIAMEKDVIEPLQAIIDVEIPQISKLRKALTKVTLDMDSAKSRYQSAIKQAQVPGVNLQSTSTKVDSVKEELDDALGRVDAAKDAYTTGLFNFISKEADYSQNLVHLLEVQAAYHQKALEEIQRIMPKMQEALNCNPVKPVYGVPLEEHLRVTNRDIAVVLEACVCYLLEFGLEEEGLFRIAGMASKVKKLKALFNAGVGFVGFEDGDELDSHTVAGALKQYLRELPEPLLTYKLFQEFVAASQQPVDQRLQELWKVVYKLPKPNLDNFRYLVKFLAKLSEKSEVNKMTPSNIAIVIGPNLIWSEGDSGPNMMNTSILSLIIELIVQHANWFFQEDQDFQATGRGQAPVIRRKSNPFINRPEIKPKPSASVTSPVSPTGGAPAFETLTGRGKSKKQSKDESAGSQSGSVLAVAQSCSGKDEGQCETGKATTIPRSSSQVRMAVLGISGPSMPAAQSREGNESAKPDVPERPRQKSSQDSASSSSESASLSDTSSFTKEYENADTLERRDSAEQYLTAKGELSLTGTNTTPASSPAVGSRRSTPVITFDPNERLKYKKSTKRPAPKPRAEMLPTTTEKDGLDSPVSRNVHSEMYSTAFALQSLGDGGTWPRYLSTVRSMWDDQLHKAGNASSDRGIVGGSSDSSTVGNGSGKGQARSSDDVQFVCSSPGGSDSPQQKKTSQSHDHQQPVQSGHNQHKNLDRTGSDQSASSQDTPQTSPVTSQTSGSQQAPAQTLPSSSRSPTVSPAVSNSSLTGPPIAESEDTNPVVRRPVRKPAPPPPERPYSVAVSASIKQNQEGFQTWPRQAVITQINEDDTSSEVQNNTQKTLPPERPHPPDRVSSLPQGSSLSHPDRPRIPPPVVPGHQRSASTGAPVTIPGAPLRMSSNEQLAELSKSGTL